MKAIIIGILYIMPLTLLSQTEREIKVFDSILYEIAINISSKNPTKALYMADSMIIHSKYDNHKAVSYLLYADILEKQDKFEKGIEYALKGLEISKRTQDYSLQAKLYGFLSTQYRTMGFIDKGKASLQKGMDVIHKVENKSIVTDYLAMANQEMADYSREERNYDQAIEYVDLAIMYYKSQETEFKDFHLANCEELLARNYLALDKKDEALLHFRKANSHIISANSSNSLWAALIYEGLGSVHLDKGSLDSAGIYLKKALVISELGSNDMTKESVYASISKYYEKTRQLDSFALYSSKHRELQQENSAKTKRLVNSEFNRENADVEIVSHNNLYLIIGILLAAVLGLIIYLKRKSIFRKFHSGGGPENESDISAFMLPLNT